MTEIKKQQNQNHYTMKRLLPGLISILLIACSPKVTTKLTETYPSLDYKQEVTVIGITEDTPPTATEIGTVKIGDTGFSINCGWDVVIEKAKMEVRKAGGNVLKIIEHTPPSMMGSSCDRITAKILKVENPKELNKIKENKTATVDSTWNYAKLFVYRPRGAGALVGYDLYLGDSILCRVKNNSKQEIVIKKKGMNSFWAKTEAKSEIPINIEFGREYYLRCTMGMGIMVGRPQLQLADRMQGKSEYNSTKSK
jgi:hypothetical protein